MSQSNILKRLTTFKSVNVQHASILMMGTMLAQLINVVSSPIITRLFTPEQFGLLSLYVSIIGPLTVLCTMRLETALVIAQDQLEKSQIKAFIYRLTVALFFIILATLTGWSFIYPSHYQDWYWLIPIGLFFNTILLIENSDKNYSKKYQKISTAKFFQSVTMALLTILLGYYLNRSHSLITANIIAVAAAWLFLRFPLDRTLTRKFIFQPSGPILSRYSRYFYFTTPASLLDVVSQQIPVFILSYYASKEMTGYYGLALKVLILPTHIIGASIAQVFLRRFSELWNDPAANLKLQLLKTWGALFAIGILPFGVLYFFGDQLFALVFGRDWSQAGVIASIIAPMLFINFVCGPSSSAILVQNNHKMGLIFGVNALITRAATLFYGVYVGDIFFGFKLWVIIEILSMAAYCATIWVNITKRDQNLRGPQ
jgi:O-antigen/teichoic acid export membrane protein